MSDELINFDMGDLTCPHCNSTSYIKVLLYSCCEKADKEFFQLAEDAYLSEPSVIWHKSWGKPEDAPWLSLKPWPPTVKS